MMQPVYQNPRVPTTESIYRTNIVIWGAMLMSQFLLLIVLYFVKPQIFGFSSLAPSTGATGEINSNISFSHLPIIILAVLGAIIYALSFIIRARLSRYAIDNKDIKLLQSAQVVAYALCEATSLLGLVAGLAFDYKYSFVWFVFGIFGILLHFPRRDKFIAAAFSGIN